jgi:pimeloyl-ACP methyl ester carboxylesterase
VRAPARNTRQSLRAAASTGHRRGRRHRGHGSRRGRLFAGWAYGDPDGQTVRGPVLVVQGEEDEDVPPRWTGEVVAGLHAHGSPGVVERTYPGVGHDRVLGASFCDVLAFLARHGGRPVARCAPYRTDLG